MSAGPRHALRSYAGVAVAVLALALVIVLVVRRRPTQPDPGGSRPGPAGVVDWCGEGLEPIAGGGCFAPSHTPGKPATLLVYLHGRYPPESAAEELVRQARVARLGSARGYAVLA